MTTGDWPTTRRPQTIPRILVARRFVDAVEPSGKPGELISILNFTSQSSRLKHSFTSDRALRSTERRGEDSNNELAVSESHP